MTKEEIFYLSIGEKIKNAEKIQLFGKPCFKIKGKAFTCFFQNEMVFKLTGETHSEALSWDGSHLFDLQERKNP